MPPLNLPYEFFGRSVKPLALAAMLAMLVISYINFADIGLFGSDVLGDVLAGFALAAGIALLGGWWRNSQTMAEIGLLMASGVWFARGTLALLMGTGSSASYGWLFSYCWVIALGGAFWLERAETLGHSRKGWR